MKTASTPFTDVEAVRLISDKYVRTQFDARSITVDTCAVWSRSAF
jgi:hypothetical protein